MLTLRFAPLAAALLAAGPTTAQSFQVNGNLLVPGGANFGRSVAAELDGDGHVDFVWQDGVNVRAAHGVFTHAAFQTLATGVTDFDVLPGAGVYGRDGLGLLLAGGLTVRTWGVLSAVDDVWESSLWTDALRVRHGELEVGIQGFVGVDADLRTILVTEGSGGHATNTFSVAYDVIDLCVLEWDDDAKPEIAILTTDGVGLYEQSGTFIEEFRGAAPGDAIVALGEYPTVDHPLAWLTTSQNLANQLLVPIGPNQTYAPPVLLGAAGTWTTGTGSQAEDLALYGGDGSEVLFVEDLGSFESLATALPTGTPLTNLTHALLRDLSGTGLGDVAVGVQTTDRIEVFERVGLPSAGPTWAETPPVVSALLNHEENGPETIDLELDMALPAGFTDPQLQALVWRREGLSDDVEHEAIENLYWDLSSTSLDIRVPLGDDLFQDVCQAPQDAADITLFVELRVVDFDNGHVVNATRPHVYALFWSEDAYDDLDANWIDEDPSIQIDFGCFAGSWVAPAVVYVRRLPPLDSSSPQYPTPDPGTQP